MATVRLETKLITDRASFHDLCKEAFGFLDGYGRNMDAWIDCMSYLYDDAGMVNFILKPDEKLFIEVTDTEGFNARLPDLFKDLVECTAFVNQRYLSFEDIGEPGIALVFL